MNLSQRPAFLLRLGCFLPSSPCLLALTLAAACSGAPSDTGPGTVPETCEACTWFLDKDGDGYGEEDESSCACAEFPDSVQAPGDCDDEDHEVYPGAEEHCNGIDDDCDGVIDPADSLDAGTWYLDQDGDGYGGEQTTLACQEPGGALAASTDCDDLDPETHPGAEETWYDGWDQDCDGADDFDADGDGWSIDDEEAPDCDDTNSEVHPEAEEICGDGVDQDCDGAAMGCGLYGVSSVDDASTTWLGERYAQQFGSNLALVGDTDGDGTLEVLVGAPLDQQVANFSGAAYLFELKGGEGRLAIEDVALAEISGTEAVQLFGSATAGLGDLNGDGFDDFLIGAGFDNVGVEESGALHIFHGPVSGSMDLSESDAIITASYENALLGYRGVATWQDEAGETVLLAASSSSDVEYENTGQVLWFEELPDSGTVSESAATARVIGTAQNENLGGASQVQGDLNGDGILDISLSSGSLGLPGARLAVFLGPLSGELTLPDADYRYTSGSLGGTMTHPMDLDGDGRHDLVVAQTNWDGVYDTSGRLEVYTSLPESGPLADLSPWMVVEGEQQSVGIGRAAAGGDLDASGRTDLVLGSGSAEPDGVYIQGGVYVFFDPDGGTATTAAANVIIPGGKTIDFFGNAIATPADMDGDGVDDLLVGALGAEGGTETGAVYLFLGGGL